MTTINLLNDWCEVCEERQAVRDAWYCDARLCVDCAEAEPVVFEDWEEPHA